MNVRRAVAASLAAVAALVGVGVTAASATEIVAPKCVAATFHTHVSNRPDSSSHGDWAKDTFDRTTEVTCLPTGAYRVNLIDSGSFTPLPNALSPAAGVPIHNLPFTGSFTGGMTFTVESYAPPVDPKVGASGKFSSSEWVALVFPKGKVETGAWGWTYKHCGETWVNASGGNSGDILGVKKCPVPPTSTSSAPPTTVTTGSTPPPVTTTVVPPLRVVVNPGQFVTTPNTSKGINTGDGSLS